MKSNTKSPQESFEVTHSPKKQSAKVEEEEKKQESDDEFYDCLDNQ
jgi:hypothetical protein